MEPLTQDEKGDLARWRKTQREAIEDMRRLYKSPHLVHEESCALRIVIEMAESWYREVQDNPGRHGVQQ